MSGTTKSRPPVMNERPRHRQRTEPLADPDEPQRWMQMSTHPISRALCQLGRHSNLQSLNMVPLIPSRPGVIAAFPMDELIERWAPTNRSLARLPAEDCRRFLIHVIIKHMWKTDDTPRYYMYDHEAWGTVVEISDRPHLRGNPRLADAPRRPRAQALQPESEPEDSQQPSVGPNPMLSSSAVSTSAVPLAAQASTSGGSRPLTWFRSYPSRLNPQNAPESRHCSRDASDEVESTAGDNLHQDAMEEMSQMLGP